MPQKFGESVSDYALRTRAERAATEQARADDAALIDREVAIALAVKAALDTHVCTGPTGPAGNDGKPGAPGRPGKDAPRIVRLEIEGNPDDLKDGHTFRYRTVAYLDDGTVVTNLPRVGLDADPGTFATAYKPTGPKDNGGWPDVD